MWIPHIQTNRQIFLISRSMYSMVLNQASIIIPISLRDPLSSLEKVNVPQRETAAYSRFHLAVYFVVNGGRMRNKSTSWSPDETQWSIWKTAQSREGTTPSGTKSLFFKESHRVWNHDSSVFFRFGTFNFLSAQKYVLLLVTILGSSLQNNVCAVWHQKTVSLRSP